MPMNLQMSAVRFALRKTRVPHTIHLGAPAGEGTRLAKAQMKDLDVELPATQLQRLRNAT